MDDKLYELFQQTLVENDNISIQRIVQGQMKAIQQPQQPKIKEESLIQDVQKKMDALEKNFMLQDSARKRRGSRYHSKKCSTKLATNNGEQPDIYQLNLEESIDNDEILQKENQRLKVNQELFQERLEELQQQSEEQDQTEIIHEKENLIQLKKEIKQKENEIKALGNKLDQQEIAINKKHALLIQENRKNDSMMNDYKRNEENIKEKREAIDALQQQINLNIAQVLSYNKAELKGKLVQKLGVQLEAVEQLMASTLKERQVIQQEYLCLRQLQNIIADQKKELQKKL